MSELFFNIQKYKKIGDFELSSGKKTKIYWDFRPLLVNYKELNLLMELYFENLWNKLDSNEKGLNLIGLEFWGAVLVPMLNFLSPNQKINYNPLILRKKKDYGIKERLLGKINPNFKTVLLDDIVFTGNTLISAIKYLKKSNIKVDKILVLINNSKLKEINSIPLDSVFKIT